MNYAEHQIVVDALTGLAAQKLEDPAEQGRRIHEGMEAAIRAMKGEAP